MPEVQVNLYAVLRKYVDGAPSVRLDIAPGETISQILDRLGVPEQQAKIIFVNNRHAAFSHPLQGGEQVDVFSGIGGG